MVKQTKKKENDLAHDIRNATTTIKGSIKKVENQIEKFKKATEKELKVIEQQFTRIRAALNKSECQEESKHTRSGDK